MSPQSSDIQAEITPTAKRIRTGLGLAAMSGLAFMGGTVAFSSAGAQSQGTDAIEAEATVHDDEAGKDRDGRSGKGSRSRGASVEVLTETLGVSEEDLRDARSDGESIADIAEANGVAVDGVINALVADKMERMAERADDLAQGRELPTEAEVTERITARVNGEAVEGRRGRGRNAFSTEAVSEALGLTPDELRDARADGESIAEVSEANGVDIDAVIDAVVATRVQAQAEHADGLPEGREFASEDEIRESVTARVNGEGSRQGRNFRGR